MFGLSGNLIASSNTRFKLFPGDKTIAVNRPKEIAIAVVSRYKLSVLPAIFPRFIFLSSDETPLVKEKNTNGTTINFNKEINI